MTTPYDVVVIGAGIVGSAIARELSGNDLSVALLEARDDVLIRRFSETRRPHPLAQNADVPAGIRAERERLSALAIVGSESGGTWRSDS